MTSKSNKSVGTWKKSGFSVFAAIIMVSMIFASVGNNSDVSLDETGVTEIDNDPIEFIEVDEFFAEPPVKEHNFDNGPVRDDYRQDRMDAYDLQRENAGRESIDTETSVINSLPSGIDTLEDTDSLPYGYTRVHKSEVYPDYESEESPFRLPGQINEDDYITYSTTPTTPQLYSVEPEPQVGGPPLHFENILLVDDDASVNNGGVYDILSSHDPAYGTGFQDALIALGYSLDVYTVAANGHGPDINTMGDYDLVIWTHGFNFGFYPIFTQNDEDNIRLYLDAGGYMWISGSMWIAGFVGGGDRQLEPGDMLYDYFHTLETGSSFGGDTNYPEPMEGSEGGIEDGAEYIFDLAEKLEADIGSDQIAQIWPQLGTDVEPVYDAPDDYYYYPYLATSWEGAYKYVMMGIEWGWLNATDVVDSMENIIEFFFPPREHGCHVTPDWQADVGAPNFAVEYDINITNTGTSTGLDVYDISYVTTEGWEVLFYEEDGVTPLTDNNLNGYVDTSVIEKYEYKIIKAKVVVPAGASLGITDVAEVTFRSQEDLTFTKTAVLETDVPYYGGLWTPTSMEAYGREDNWVMLTAELQNGGASDTLDLTVSSPQGWTYEFYDEDGLTALTNNLGSVAVDTDVMAPLEAMDLRIMVDIPASTPPGTIDNAVITSTSVEDNGASADFSLDVTVAYEIEYFEDVESGEGLFTHGANVGLWDNWATSTDRANSPSTSWTSGNEPVSVSDSYLESPYIFLEYRDAPSAKMDMYHWYNFFDASYYFEDGIVDGGIVEVWDGVTEEWNYITPDEGYDGPINSDYLNPLGGIEAFGGSSGSAWAHDYFDIYPYILNGINRQVVNETFSPGGGTSTLTLANIGVIDLDLYRIRGGGWYLMDDRDDYSLDPATGEIDLTPSSVGGDTYHAFYNYTLGNAIKFRWRVGTDLQATGADGWFIDDIRVRMPEWGAITKPDYQEGWGYDGDEVSYNFTVENIGWGGNDVFDLEYASNLGWSGQFYDTNWAPRTQTISMAPGMTRTYWVNVSIPGGHTGGYDFGAVWANSTNGGTDESIAITVARPYIAAWSDDFESGIDEYNYIGNAIGDDAEWHLSPNETHSPTNSLYFGQEDIQEYGEYAFGIIDSPLIEIPTGGNYAELNIWHSYSFEPGYDGGIVEIGTENGTVYDQVYPDRGYDWTLAPGWGNYGLEGKAAFSGNTGTYINDVFEISDYIGKVIKVSFIAGGDSVWSSHRGWNIDDISVFSPDYAVDFAQDKMPGFGDAGGDQAVYELEVRNKGKFTDIFTFSDGISGGGWDCVYMDDQWNVLSGDTTPSMASGEIRTFYANVTIPGVTPQSYSRSDVITASSNGGSATDTMTAYTFVADQLLLVIDDFENDMASGGAGYDGYNDLITATYGISYDTIDIEDHGLPNIHGMNKHTGAIWATAGVGGGFSGSTWDTRPPLFWDERALIEQFLDDDGRMYFAGNLNLAAAFGGYGPWVEEYFGWGPMVNWAFYTTTGTGNPGWINGTDGTMMQGMNLWCSPLIGGHPDADDVFSVNWEGGSDPFQYMFTEGVSNDASGLYLDDGISRRMTTAFQIINVQDGINSTTTRQALMQEVINFLFPVQDVWIGPVEKYTLPGQPSTQASYTLEVRNAGKTADSFAITKQSGSWTTTFYDDGWNVITNTGTLQPNEKMTVFVNVSIPGGATPGDIDTSRIRFDGGGYWSEKNLSSGVPEVVTYNYDAEGLDGATSDDGWTVDATSLWHIEDTRRYTGTTSWAFNNGVDYDTGNVEEGGLFSPWIDLSGGTLAELSWWEFVDVEGAGGGYDTCYVYISTDGMSWAEIYNNALASGVWSQKTVDLSSYLGETILLQFYFTTGDTNSNDHEGWFIDDVQVYNPSYIGIYDRTGYFGFEDAGATASMDILLTNKGAGMDTFNLDVIGETWTAAIWDQGRTQTITSIQLDQDENTTLHVDISIPGGAAQADDDPATFRATSTGDASQWDVGIKTYVKDPILLVSDDFEKGIDNHYKAMLDANPYGGVYAYDWIDTYTMGGSPNAQNMFDHDAVIWHTVGSGRTDPNPPWNPDMLDGRQPITEQEMNDLAEFMDGGGRLYMSSNAPFAMKSNYYMTGEIEPVLWAWDYLGMESYTNFPWPYPGGEQHLVWGVDDDPIGDGFETINQIILHNPSGDGHPDCKEEGTSAGKFDWVNYDGGFQSAFEETWWGGWTTGTTLNLGSDRRVWTSWDLATVDTAVKRNEMMRRILTFLAPPPTGVTVSPSYQLGQVYAGDSYMHEITVKNIGATSDLYDITISGDVWTATLYEADGVTPLSNNGGGGAPDTGTLAPLQEYTIKFKVQSPGGANPGDNDLITIRATSDNDGGTWMEVDVDTSVPYLILLVDDDGSVNNGGDYGMPFTYHYAEDPTLGAPGHGTPYADALTALGYDFDTYVVPVGEDGPPQDMLNVHSIVIWVCGGTLTTSGTLNPIDQVRLANFLDNGGRLWLDSAGLAWDLVGSYSQKTVVPGSFTYEYLGIETTDNSNLDSPTPYTGVATSIMEGVNYPTTTYWEDDGVYVEFDLRVGAMKGAWNSAPGDTLSYTASQWDNGVFKTFYTGTEWAFINTPANRQDAMLNIMNWFLPTQDVVITPPEQEWYGTPGGYVWYNMTVQNKGNSPDSYIMSRTSSQSWTYSYFESDMVTPLSGASTGTIASYGQKDIAVRVTVPGGASDGTWDLGTVTATSGGESADADINTLVYVAPGTDYKSVYIGNMPEKDGGAQVTLFSDDVESGTNGWTSTDWLNTPGTPSPFDWHIVEPTTLPEPPSYNIGHSPAHSPDNVWWYGNDSSGDAHYQSWWWARLQSPSIDLSGYASAQLSFWEWFDTHEFWYPDRIIEIDEGSGYIEETILPYEFTDVGTWIQRTVDLTPYAGQTIQIGFNQSHTAAWDGSKYPMWYLDDFVVSGFADPDNSDGLMYNSFNWTTGGNLIGNPTINTVDYYGTSVPLQSAVTNPTFAQGAPDNSRAVLQDSGSYIGTGGNWGSGSGTILKVEIGAEYRSTLGLANGFVRVACYDSVNGYTLPTMYNDYVSRTTDYLRYVDITDAKPFWTWSELGNMMPYVYSFANSGNNVDVDAVWIRVTSTSDPVTTFCVVDSWGTLNQDLWGDFTDRHGDVILKFLPEGPFTYGDIVLTEADAILISGGSREYSAAEKAAIAQYTAADGNGIMGTGDFMDYAVLGNKDLAPLFGLKAETIPWSVMFTEYEVQIPSHPVMDGLPNPFAPDDPLSKRISTGAIPEGAIVVAHADTIESGVVAVMENDVTAPTFAGLASTSGAGAYQIDLNWAAASDPNPTITYNVYMALGGGDPPLDAPSFQTTGSTGFSVTGLAPSTQYSFIVRAQDAYGNEETNTVRRTRTTSAGAGSDSQAPAIQNLVHGLNPAGDTITVQYRANDTGLGDSNIFTAGYNIVGQFSGYFPAKDGSFDGIVELIQSTIDVSSLGDGTYTLQIKAWDVYGNEGMTSVQFSKGPRFTKMLSVGWSYLSIPLDVSDQSISSVLSSIAGDYNAVQFYNNTIGTDGWEHYNIDDPLFADFDYIDHEMGFWVNVTSPSVLVVSGSIPGSTGITLREGWNMVGYPSQSTTSSIGDKLSTITYDQIAGPDEYGLNVAKMTITDLMIPGSGYWIHVPTGTGDQTWTVT